MRPPVLLAVLAAMAALSATIAAVPPPPLPEPVTNNVVAVVEAAGREHIVSLLGIGPGKTWRDLRAGGYLYAAGSEHWEKLPDVPDGEGRIAASSVAVAGGVLIFGGYTVAAGGGESSRPYVYRFDVATRRYRRLADIPTPVDDTAALLYRDRYVYLVSGWHDQDNVPFVQLYDVEADRWRQATPFPGTPVFGHAGAIAGNRLLVCDGVRVVREPDRGRYAPSGECWIGEIDGDDPGRIDWSRAPAHPGPPRYRMAALARGGEFLFVGGTANPYNYDGVGYDGRPSEPETGLLRFDPRQRTWRTGAGPAVMDLRSLAVTAGGIYTVGGMRAGQAVSASVVAVEPKEQR